MSAGKKLRVGLVLTSGGARAAYQAGAIRALARLPIECAAVSAVGAGALNGVLLAANPIPADAAHRMACLWRQAVQSPGSALQLGPIPVARLGLYLTLLYAGGANPTIHEVLRSSGRGANALRHARRSNPMSPDADPWSQVIEFLLDQLNVSTDAELDAFLSSSLAEAAANVKIPFFVAAHRSGDSLLDRLMLALRGAGIIDPGPATFLPVHEMAPDMRLGAVLASATLPFACEPNDFDGAKYVDGSFGGFGLSQGAVPVTPLLDLAGLQAIIVVHTEAGVPWDVADYPQLPILEVRPSRGKAEGGVGYFWTDEQALSEWIDLGEQDAASQIARFLEELRGSGRLLDARDELRRATDWLDD